MSEANCEPPVHNFREGEKICNCTNAFRSLPPDKTPDEIMAWLAGLLCGVCGGHGGAQVAVTAPDGEHRGSESEDCTACRATGRLLWRLVERCRGWWVVVEDKRRIDRRWPLGHVLGSSMEDIPPDVRTRQQHGDWCCGDGNGLVTLKPTLEMLIDTGLDLGYATVFTPDEWDEHVPAAWITVSTGQKIEDLLCALVALVERHALHGREAQDAGPAS